MVENKNCIDWETLNGPNLGYLLEQYEHFQREPGRLIPRWANYSKPASPIAY